MGVAAWSVLLRPNETSLNVLLVVPLGLALGALPGSPRAAVLIVGAFLLPVAIELFQLAVPALGRGCQSADVIDNTMGLVIGLALGFAGHRLLGRRGPT
jgi:glycopeptide antibiotics resistance protein